MSLLLPILSMNEQSTVAQKCLTRQNVRYGPNLNAPVLLFKWKSNMVFPTITATCVYCPSSLQYPAHLQHVFCWHICKKRFGLLTWCWWQVGETGEALNELLPSSHVHCRGYFSRMRCPWECNGCSFFCSFFFHFQSDLTHKFVVGPLRKKKSAWSRVRSAAGESGRDESNLSLNLGLVAKGGLWGQEAPVTHDKYDPVFSNFYHQTFITQFL